MGYNGTMLRKTGNHHVDVVVRTWYLGRNLRFDISAGSEGQHEGRKSTKDHGRAEHGHYTGNTVHDWLGVPKRVISAHIVSPPHKK